MQRLKGRAAIVTGAGQGIGRGVARRFAREGANVVVAELDEKTGRACADEIAGEFGVRSVFVATDVGGVAATLGGAGELVPAGDADALASAVGRILDDPELQDRLSARARHRAAALPTDDDAVEQVERLLSWRRE